jgi:hypothetical protein
MSGGDEIGLDDPAVRSVQTPVCVVSERGHVCDGPPGTLLAAALAYARSNSDVSAFAAPWSVCVCVVAAAVLVVPCGGQVWNSCARCDNHTMQPTICCHLARELAHAGLQRHPAGASTRSYPDATQ